MTETEWLACDDPERMLRHLRRRKRRPGARKYRLFCVACCRHSAAVMDYAENRRCVEVAERSADGLALREARRAARGARRAFGAAINAAGEDPVYDAVLVVDDVANYAANASVARGGGREGARRAEAAALARLLRDVVGNPFRPPRLDPAWLADRVAVRLAEAIYDERAFDRLPILADALEEPGCTNGDILSHCRGPGPHVRGCWVIDLLLGKQ